jgi:predicted transcriptional regulator
MVPCEDVFASNHHGLVAMPAAPLPNLRLLDQSPIAKELDLASELFHRVNRIIPQDQKILTIPPNCRVRDAVALMRQHGFSQLPIVENGQVFGVFSYRSFSQNSVEMTLDDWIRQRTSPGDLQVDEFMEQFEFARVTEELSRVFDAMDRDNGILIGAPNRLIGILTPMDFLRYLSRVASPFVLVSEIELAIRALIHCAMSPDQIGKAALLTLGAVYGGADKVPRSLEEMTFDNYRTLITNGENWASFEPLFAGTRTRTGGKLKEIGAIRNDLFHFKRELTTHDHETLSNHRNWLLAKIKQVQSRRAMEAKP